MFAAFKPMSLQHLLVVDVEAPWLCTLRSLCWTAAEFDIWREKERMMWTDGDSRHSALTSRMHADQHALHHPAVLVAGPVVHSAQRTLARRPTSAREFGRAAFPAKETLQGNELRSLCTGRGSSSTSPCRMERRNGLRCSSDHRPRISRSPSRFSCSISTAGERLSIRWRITTFHSAVDI